MKKIINKIRQLVLLGINRPRLIGRFLLLVSTLLVLLVALPSIWPDTFHTLNPLRIDTDPENMLSEDEAVRRFHNEMKNTYSLYDMVILGVVNDSHPQGVFNPDSLRKIYQLTEFAKTLSDADVLDPQLRSGVVIGEIISPSDVDNVEQAGPGAVRFDWLMDRPPEDDEAAIAIRDKAKRIPFLDGTLVSEDGKAVAIYIPLTSKDQSYRVAKRLRAMIADLDGDESYYITGLPVSEDQFGVEMFIQMAICAPLAMLVVCLLLFYFFKRVALVAASMAVAMVAVIVSMSLLVITGNTVHIMSSMIPIFIMPIAVLDSVHILSEFFDRHGASQDRRDTLVGVMDTLFRPMLFTSLTTAAGFLSLALTPIPPVQVFGIFIAVGVMVAWLVTITFVPACIMMMKPASLKDYGAASASSDGGKQGLMGRPLALLGRLSSQHARLVLIVTLFTALTAIYGITQIVINDNPVRWFDETHEIRVADRVLNSHFGGTYMAYLSLQAQPAEEALDAYAQELSNRFRLLNADRRSQAAGAVVMVLQSETSRLARTVADRKELLSQLETFIQLRHEVRDDLSPIWLEALQLLDAERQTGHVFKQPDALAYIQQLQAHLLTTGVVGKSNSIVDIVATVNRELHSGNDDDLKIPDTAAAVAQTLLTFQSSHRPQDLWHFVTVDYENANIWVQLKSGDNVDMSRVVAAVDEFVAANPPPYGIVHRWFGLNYINVVWQEKMVKGMVYALASSFLVVFLMMVFLFRSLLWGLLCMVPLSITIGVIYGIVGIIGKDYDMPIAVLSSLSLGLSVDYAVHFCTRTRIIYDRTGSWAETLQLMFAEPARAISRNAIVNGVGFMPLLIAPLVPYQTVGIFIASILLMAGVATLVILPAMITTLQARLFRTASCPEGTSTQY